MLTREIRTPEGRKEGKGCETGEREVRDPGALGGPHLSCFQEIATCPSVGPRKVLGRNVMGFLVHWTGQIDGSLP